MAIDGLLIRAMRDAGRVGCDCFSAYDANTTKFSWSGSTGATLDKTFQDSNTYSMQQLLKKLGALPSLTAVLEAKYGSSATVTFKDVVQTIVTEAKKGNPQLSDYDALARAGFFA